VKPEWPALARPVQPRIPLALPTSAVQPGSKSPRTRKTSPHLVARMAMLEVLKGAACTLGENISIFAGNDKQKKTPCSIKRLSACRRSR